MRGAARSRRALSALAAAALASAALPSAATAATNVSVTANVIRAVSDPGESNQVVVEFDVDSNEVHVFDLLHGITVAAPCVDTGFEADCPLSIGDPARIIVRAGDGRDNVAEGSLLALVEPYLETQGLKPILEKLGPGDDRGQAGLGSGRIVGGPGNDRMTGLDGSDTLIGGPGNDVLDRQLTGSTVEANTGRDRYFAGPGADKIRARDFTRDLRISCGPGRDVLSRDRFDPRPSGCT